MAIFQVRRFVFPVYVFECFILAELYKLVVKTIRKLAYEEFLVAICARSMAPKALKGFFMFFLRTSKIMREGKILSPYAKKRTKVQLFFRIRKNVRIFDDFSTFYFCF